MELSCHYTPFDSRMGKLTFDCFPKGTAGPIGNALRRTLLSEIEGVAVTAVKISGACHGFDTLRGVREDLTEIVAHLQQLELKLHSAQKKRLTICTQQRHVTALDIEHDGDVEILNPHQPIATLNPGVQLQIQMEIQKGRGFRRLSASDAKRLYNQDMYPITANFSPLKRVGYRVETSGEGSECLVMQITTNGTLSPLDAVFEAAGVLVTYLEESRVSGTFNGCYGKFRLKPGAINLLGHALKWELLSHFRSVLDVAISPLEVEIWTDGHLPPKAALATSLQALRDRLTSLLVTLQNPHFKQENIRPGALSPQKGPIRFGDLRFVEDTPDLLFLQRDSYREFLAVGLPEVLNEIFPITGADGETRLELSGHHLDQQLDAETCLKQGKTYAASLVLSLRLNTAGGRKTEEFQAHVGDLPLMTEEGTFIIQGTPRIGVSQLHRSPGVLFEKNETYITARIIPYRGSWVEFETATDATGVQVRLDRRKSLPATVLLRAFGVETDEEILALFAQMEEDERALIQRTLQDDTTASREEALIAIYQIWHEEEPPDIRSATARFRRLLLNPTRYDLSRVGRRQLNRKLGLDVPEEERLLRLEDLVAVIKRLLKIHCRRARVDDLASLTERRVRTVGELMRIQFVIGLMRMARHAREKLTLGVEGELTPEEVVEPRFVSTVLRDFWEGSPLSQYLEQTNPLSELGHKRRLTSLGPGGVDREHAGFEIRDVHHTHYGRICPVETPEGPNVGLITTLTNHARINADGFIEAPYQTLVNGRPAGMVKYRSPQETQSAIESLAYPQQLLGLSASLIPLIEHDETRRALMGANMQRQAIPLLFTEPPLVRSGMEQKAAYDSRAMVHARISGRVTSVTADEIVIQGHDGTSEKHVLTKFRPSTFGTSINQKPTVTVGEVVRTGEPIADGPAIKDGMLSLGRNVLVAYMPWQGYNYKDGIVISDRLIREDLFTSVHIEKIRVEARHTEEGIEYLTPDLPGKVKEDISHLDDHGIARVGTWINATDIVVGKVSPRIVDEPKLTDLLEAEPVQYANTPAVAPAHVEGQVIRTRYLARRRGDDLPPYVEEVAIVEIALRREVQVGDKFAGRHGNKGIVARIVPEADMPYLADGTPVDVILNPLGVPTRLNYGQILETHLGWAAQKLQQPLISPPYDGPTSAQIKALLARAGCPENGMTPLFDGRTGRPYDMEVTVGYQYLMKLNHLVVDKIHARSIGPYSIVTQQPLGGRAQMGGQRLGEMEVWALEAYGAAHTLYEMMTVKSNATTGLLFYKRIAQGDLPGLEDFPQEAPTFKLLTVCLRGLGIDLSKDERAVHIRLASPEQIRAWSQGEVRLKGPAQGDPAEASLVELAEPHAMGHVELALPIAHAWFFKEESNPMALVLDLTGQQLAGVLYFERYIVLDTATEALEVGQVLTREEYETLQAQHDFRAGIGGGAIRELLARVDLASAEKALSSAIERAEEGETKEKLKQRLRLIRGLLQAGVRPEWMVMETLPVVPQSIRPTVPISDDLNNQGRLATSDLNLLYGRVIYRNDRLKQLMATEAPEAIIHNEARQLQQAVDALLDQGHQDQAMNQPLQSLADILTGKGGIFRGRLLGARVDYSARSVIAPGPELKMDECGLPREMALKLFEPFVIQGLVAAKTAGSVRAAKRIVDEKRPEAMAMLDQVIEGRVVVLNRAPTMHRASLQAFKPVLIEEKAIRLHPLMCPAFNADFDGDQMAVHLPLTRAAQKEAWERMLAPRNLISPANGHLLAQPDLELLLGCHYLTLSRPRGGQGITTPMTKEEAKRAYELGEIGLHDKIIVQWKDGSIPTTVGRVYFNEILEDTHPYVNETLTKARLFEIVESVFKGHGEARAVTLLERLTAIGFRFATQMGVSISLNHLETDFSTTGYIRRIEKEMANQRMDGSCNPQPNQAIHTLLSECEEALFQSFKANAEGLHPLYLMHQSGALELLDGSLRQATGMLGVQQEAGKPPGLRFLGGNYRDGLDPDQHFIVGRSGRKSLADFLAKMAATGYLFRRLVEVASGVVITEADCGTEKARNPVHCKTGYGLCARCYGTDLATGRPVQPGTPVGLIAATALGERAPQLPPEDARQLSELFEAGLETLQVMLAEQGMEALAGHLLAALRAIYLDQGIEIDAKHFALIIRQMLSQVKIVRPGDTSLFAGEQVSRTRLAEENAMATAKGGQPATHKPLLAGISQVALASDSFLFAAASRQASRVLARAALSGISDPLRGMHECVIAGKRIPAGTGFSQ